MRQHHNNTGLDAIQIKGGLFSATVVSLLRHYQLPGQTTQEYGIEKGLKLSDELGRFWRIAQAHWQQFADLRTRDDLDPEKVAVESWLLPLLTKVFGFELEQSPLVAMGERTFPITHSACQGAVPLVLIGDGYLLEKGNPLFGESGKKRSPSGLLQEYLNAGEHCLWGIVSNGLTLRLLRDNPAMTRPAYVEIDLERLFEEELYVDFTVFWLLLQATRLSPIDGKPEKCLLEQWRSQGQEDGERVLGELRHGVTNALRILGTGFVAHPDNQGLREAIRNETLSTDQLFQELLRLIYRFLFLFTTEDRDVLLDPEDEDHKKQLYKKGYSISVLRERARFRRHYDSYSDGWQQLCITFAGFATGQPMLAQPALGGLFAKEQCRHLEQYLLANKYLYDALFKLCYFEHNGVLTRINYRDMDTEELGSVYESLLELIPQFTVNGQWHFGFLGDEEGEGSAAGHARKLTGSYYTPDSLVQELIKSALDPVIKDRLAKSRSNPRGAVLAISVCDPACGSGHFLLAAARRLAAELARIEAGTDQPTEADYRHALREVVSHCIYGVDLNPLAVELCRTALWLEAIEPGKPLGFLDAHIQVGNSLVGILGPEILTRGIPPEAYKPLTGDDKKAALYLKRINKDAAGGRQLSLFDQQQMLDLSACALDLDIMPEENLEQVQQKSEAWQRIRSSSECQKEHLIANLFTAAFYAEKTESTLEQVPTSEDLARIHQGRDLSPKLLRNLDHLIAEHRFFHWHLAFPEIFIDEKGGFDVVLGNPPWEKIKLIEKEYFASVSTDIAGAGNAAARTRLIEALPKKGKAGQLVYNRYVRAKRAADAASNFARTGGRYPLTGVGDINLYALFAEIATQLVNESGRVGVIIPSGIATDKTTKAFFDYLLSSQRLHHLFEFENEGFFKGPGSGHMVRFALTTIGGANEICSNADFMFQGKKISDLSVLERRFKLSASDIALLNPNTKTCPIFQTQTDAELTKKLYKAAPVLIKEASDQDDEINPWGIKFQAMFHMSNDSGLFKTKIDFQKADAKREGICWTLEGQRYVPLYEAKMMYLYNHRHGDFGDAPPGERPHRLQTISSDRLSRPEYEVEPFYWIKEHTVNSTITDGWARNWLMAWRRVTDSRASIRTFIPCILPRYGTGDSIFHFYTDTKKITAKQNGALIANCASLILDWIARQKLGGINLSYYYLKQFPILPPAIYKHEDLNFITSRVLELTYTAKDLKSFAQDLDYEGPPFPFDPERRHQLKCELDAYFARLYGLNRDELRYILDPAEVMGEDYPSETFRVLKNREINEFGEYRTQRLVLEAWDRLQ